MNKKSHITVKNLAHGYKNRDGKTLVLYEDVNIEVERESVMVILGRNGVGKSTLLKSFAGLKPPLFGEILIDGEPIESIGAKRLSEMVSFVSTEIINMRNLTVRSVVGLGRAPYTNWIGRLNEEDDAMVCRAIRLVGMGGFEDVSIDSVSDGERQRVMIARALAQDTPIVLLDEPTAFLDVPNKYEIALLLQKLAHEHGKTIIFSTHDLDIALRLGDKICIIDLGRFSVGTPEDMVIAGEVDPIFAGTVMNFDVESLHVKLNTVKRGEIFLNVDTQYRYLFEKALERVGYGINTDNEFLLRVDATVNNKTVSINYKNGTIEKSFSSVGDLLTFLRGES